jgi:hypothetical protein
VFGGRRGNQTWELLWGGPPNQTSLCTFFLSNFISRTSWISYQREERPLQVWLQPAWYTLHLVFPNSCLVLILFPFKFLHISLA